MNKKKILHVDGNNFFASCEVLMNPDLIGKPVCVLSNNDGCVVSRSYEAKKLGVPMGIPYFMAKKQFYGVQYLSSNFALYHDISSRMMKHLYKFSDKVDIYSIDEAFLDITNLDTILKLSWEDIAKKVKSTIEEEIGIKVSVGIANSKMLAKLATHKAKHSNGTYVINTENINQELLKVPTEDIWGIGKNIARTLRKYGIFYAHEIILKDDNFYKDVFGKKGLELKYELMGISVIPLTGEEQKPKSIQRTRAFPEFTRDETYIKSELLMHLHNVCKKLREYNLKTKCLAVMLRTKDFRVSYLDTKLEHAANSEIVLGKIANKLFEKIFYEGIIYRSTGVIAFDLEDTEKEQLQLFKDTNSEKGNKLSEIIDKIENKYGKGSLSLGDTGIKAIQEKHKRKSNK